MATTNFWFAEEELNEGDEVIPESGDGGSLVENLAEIGSAKSSAVSVITVRDSEPVRAEVTMSEIE